MKKIPTNTNNSSKRLAEVVSYLKMSYNKLSEEIGLDKNTKIYYVKNGRNEISNDLAKIITDRFQEIDYEWLLTGVGKMLKGAPTEKTPSEKYIEEEQKRAKKTNLIPMYDDVSTFGSTNQNADLTAVSTPTEYIDAGTWFGNTKITAAIRHYGDSMVEYPNGCILALKEIRDRQNIIPGRNYVIETDEIRVTKRLQLCDDDKFFTAYSSNNETYPDGRQIHEPFKIKKKKISKVFLVVGRIVKEHSSGAVTILD